MIQNIMQQIKYQGKRNLAFEIGMLCGSLTDAEFTEAFDVIIPIPLHKKRITQRGYNQAELFARGIAAGNSPRKVRTDLLQRIRNTTSQTKLDKSQRKKNLDDAFALSDNAPEHLANKSILLIDDVITTGATTAAATEVLLKSGCASVTVLSFARD